MKKWILASLATVLLAPAAGFTQGDMLLSIKAGVNLANVSMDPEPDPGPEMKIGVIGGVGFTAGLSDMFGIRAEMLYSQKGSKMTLDIPFIGERETETTINYIDIPITGVLRFPNMDKSLIPNVFLGPVFSVKMGDASVSVNGDEVENDGEDDGIKGFDMGLTFGAGLDFGMGNGMFGVDARYTLGLTEIEEETDGDNVGSSTKHNVISIMLNYTFNLSR